MKRLIPFVIVILWSCSSEDVTQQIVIGENKNTVSFASALASVDEGESLTIELNFERPLEAVSQVTINFTSANAIYDDDFVSSPTAQNESIVIAIPEGESTTSFSIATSVDTDTETEKIEFSFASSSENVDFARNEMLTVNITDILPVDNNEPASDDLLTVVTWNIEFFPMDGNNTVNTVRDIILDMDADIIALQEINDPVAFAALDDLLTGWEGKLLDVRGSIELAYLYKTSEITSFSNLSSIYNNDSDAFPRQPVLATATHKNGLEVTLINLHLKCCSNGEARRGVASTLLKSHIDTNLASDNVIVLGDYNDDVLSGSPFSNFVSDSENYLFTDTDISQTSNISNWSYPSWPSHLDHILITNELFDNFVSVETLKLDETVNRYFSNVSDHRPVSATFEN